ncbi:methyltransferase domain-containing protein [Pleurocapsales cyanobacterium LEGE 10410]|nr:methyltransferase domain-containing protein [Pleurocapsales cyanobacterium LEGE 10410]
MIFQRTAILLAIAFSPMVTGCNFTVDATTQADSQTPASTTAQTPALGKPDVIYVPTPPEVVEQMLAMAEVDQNDVLYDLGSGDGRIPITAVRDLGVSRAVGIEIDPQRIREANANAEEAGVSDRVNFLNQDLFQSNFSDATVVTLYLLPTLNVRLRPQLLSQLKPGTRIVSHDFDMGEWQPERTEQVEANGRMHTIYLWTVPENPPADLLGNSGAVFP